MEKFSIIIYVISAIMAFAGIETARYLAPKNDFFTKTLNQRLYLFFVFTPFVNSLLVIFTIVTIGSMEAMSLYRFLTIYFPNKIRRALGYYDSFGLKYSISHLDRIKNLIPTWNRKDQAVYVDKMTILYFHEIDKDAILAMPPETWYTDVGWDTTTIGNMAYACIHIEDKEIASHLDLCLENLRMHFISVNK